MPRTCGIVDVQTGEVCQEPLHWSWPFCRTHGQEYKSYLDTCEEAGIVDLPAERWAKWRRNGGVRV